MSEIIIEIRAAEGGDDAKQLVSQQFAVYQAYAKTCGAQTAVLEQAPG